MTRRRRTIPAALTALTALAAHPPTVAHGQPHEAPAARPADAAARAPQGDLGRRIAAAPAGATVIVDPGVYRERLVIDKPLTLIGRPGAVIDGGGSGDIIEITAPDVTVRGLTVRNTGIDLDKENAAVRVLAPRATLESLVLEDVLFGIDLREAPDSTVRGNTIGGKRLDIARRGDGLRLWRSDRSLVEGNTVHDGRDAIIWYSTGVTVRNNLGRDCRYGLHLMFSDSVTIESNRFENNSVGVYLMYSTGVEVRGNRLTGNRGPSGYGLGLKETDRFTVRDNLIAANRAGIYVDGSPFTASIPGVFTRNTVACNDVGVVFLPSARGNELFENNFIDNIDQVAVAGRGDLSANRFFKGERGNFWSDYTGYDLNGDGVGDFVHESQTLFENLMDRHPSLRLMLFSPAQQAIEFVGRAVPAVRPEAKFTDEVPLMRPVEIGLTAADAPAGAPAQAAGAALLLTVGGGLVGLARAGRRATGGDA
ncbi:MAG: nitrous oxide reductase family maturation protein NosD [Phycisphaerae bacterium]|nr:nitrous oxide reductase family maturation protein NosD [Phycisphaerae bacterium]